MKFLSSCVVSRRFFQQGRSNTKTDWRQNWDLAICRCNSKFYSNRTQTYSTNDISKMYLMLNLCRQIWIVKELQLIFYFLDLFEEFCSGNLWLYVIYWLKIFCMHGICRHLHNRSHRSQFYWVYHLRVISVISINLK